MPTRRQVLRVGLAGSAYLLGVGYVIGPGRRRRAFADDDEGALEFCSLFLKDRMDVDYFKSGEEALAAVEKGAYDYLLLDVKMAGLGGPEILERLKGAHPELVPRVAFVTGDTVDPATLAFLSASGRPYLLKPFTPAMPTPATSQASPSSIVTPASARIVLT